MKKQRTQRDFLLTIALYERTFNDNYLLKMSCEAETFQMIDFIEKFCHLMQLHQMAQTEKKSHQTAFFAANIISDFENSESAFFFTFNDRAFVFFKMISSVCICDFKH